MMPPVTVGVFFGSVACSHILALAVGLLRGASTRDGLRLVNLGSGLLIAVFSVWSFAFLLVV